MTREQQLLVIGLGVGLVVLLSSRVSTSRKSSTPTSSTKPVATILPIQMPIYTPPSTPVQPKPATSSTTAKPAPPSRDELVKRTVAAIRAENRTALFSPVATPKLAEALVDMCAELSYPLDLAFGHAWAESNLKDAYNKSSQADGPLQVTPIAARQVGAAWPAVSVDQKVWAGLKYMLWLRNTYPECRASVKTALQHYGMGRGNWLKFRAHGCGTAPCTNMVSVFRAECGCGRQYSATTINMARRHPELKTVPWWGGTV